MSTKKQSAAKPAAVHEVRSGETRAIVYQAQTNAGFKYFQFVLTRSWSSLSTGKESQGNSFFPSNEHEIIQAVREASAWIRARVQQTLDVSPPAHPLDPEESTPTPTPQSRG